MHNLVSFSNFSINNLKAINENEPCWQMNCELDIRTHNLIFLPSPLSLQSASWDELEKLEKLELDPDKFLESRFRFLVQEIPLELLVSQSESSAKRI